MLPDPQIITLQGRQQAWREAGHGVPVVLVHGLGTDSRMWAAAFKTFSKSYRVIAWDAPGYGLSTPFDVAAPTSVDYVDALAALLAERKVSDFHLLGHSVGAVIAVGLCGRGFAPRTLTLIHPVAGGGRLDPEKREQIRSARIEEMRSLGPRRFAETRGPSILGPELSEAARVRAVDNMAQVTADGYVQAWEMMCQANIFTELQHVRAPSMVLAGGADPVAQPAVCEQIAAQLKAETFKVFDGIGHSLPAEAPDQLNNALAGFLSRHAT